MMTSEAAVLIGLLSATAGTIAHQFSDHYRAYGREAAEHEKSVEEWVELLTPWIGKASENLEPEERISVWDGQGILRAFERLASASRQRQAEARERLRLVWLGLSFGIGVLSFASVPQWVLPSLSQWAGLPMLAIGGLLGFWVALRRLRADGQLRERLR